MNTVKTRLPLLAACIIANSLALPLLADDKNHDIHYTKKSVHNFAHRKVVHADQAVAHVHAHEQHYVHHKAAKARNWLDHH